MAQQYREIILHAGLGKTGTSSIQDNCWRHREALLAEGICFPRFQLGSRRLVNHSDVLAGAVCSAPEEHGVLRRHGESASAGSIRRQLRAQLDPLLAKPAAEVLVLSGEAVANFSDRDLQALRCLLAPHTRRLRVIAFIRSPQSAMESMLQQRARGGNPVAEDSLSGVVKARYLALERNFAGLVEWVDFHRACEHPDGVVGTFCSLIGLSPETAGALEFTTANASMSQEAYELMAAINGRFPRDQQARHQVRRRAADLGALAQLPGQRFRIPGFLESPLYAEALAEAAWLEERLGFSFPPLPARPASDHWQMETLEVLEETIRKLQPKLQQAAAEHLLALSEQLARTRPRTAGALELIGRRLQRQRTPEISRLAEQLGADYFRYAALQAEPHSPKLALTLMSVALALKPEGEMIKQRVHSYRRQLALADE